MIAVCVCVRTQALVGDQSTKISSPCPGASVPFYRAALPLSPQTLTYLAGVIRRHRRSIGSAWRLLNPRQQALLVLTYLRKGETFGDLAAGFAVSTTTAWRYVEETVKLLAARAPKARYGAAASPGRRKRLPRLGRHLDPDRPRRRRPALLLRKAPQTRNEPASHRHTYRGHRVGVGRAARRHPRPDGRPDLGHPARTTGGRADHTRRQGLSRRRRANHPLQGQGQTRISKERQPRPRSPARSR